ncbi:hypothetical protein BBJ28_00001081 [Nothophytophthora sp. Chile5]|nr:hypothetical protein BBJ28_00001081 [Nothophytophthora sp. Chile5]
MHANTMRSGLVHIMPGSSSHRVVVVGAGVAGVSAANALLASGEFGVHDVCVLEAQSRIGGRVHTRAISDEVSLDVGAAWIHGTEGNPFIELAHKFGIVVKQISARNPWLHPASCPDFLLFEGRRQLSEEEIAETWEWQDLLLRKLQVLATSESAAIDHVKSLAAGVEQLVAEDSELRELIASVSNARERLDLCLRLRFIDHLSAPVKTVIRTNARVVSINCESSDGVVIECADGRRVTADRVVVTCSLGFLKSGKLLFQPELPVAKAAAIARSQMGQCMKVLVQFPTVFWPRDATFMAQIKDMSDSSESKTRRIYFPIVFSYYATKGAAVLEGDLVGSTASEISSTFSDDEIVHALVLQLRDTFGQETPEPVKHFVTRWDRDEYALGAYSTVTVESSYEDPDLLCQTVANRVLFAGEATNYEYQGALQAAYISGKCTIVRCSSDTAIVAHRLGMCECHLSLQASTRQKS